MAPSTSEFVSIFIVLSIPFLYEMSSAFRYHFKFIIYYLYISTVSILMIPVMAFRPRDCRNAIMASRFCRGISPLLGINWKLRGEEYFGMEGSCVIVANHQSSLDVLGMFEFWHVMGKCTIVAKKELFYAWPFGLAAWLCGLTFVDRMKSDEAREVMNNSAQLIKSEKVKMWVFPEGTRKNTGELHSFKKGAFHVAIAAQIPIQPVVFSPFYFLNNKERTLNQGKVIITALPPISTEGLQPGDVNVLVERVREIMVKEFNRVSEEIYSSLPVTVRVSCKKADPSLTRTSPPDKGHAPPNDKEHASLTDKEHASLTDKEHASLTDMEHASLTDKGHASLTDKGHASLTDTEHASLTDKEHDSLTDMEHASLTDKGHASLTDKEHASLTDKEHASLSNKKHTSLSDKQHVSLTDKTHTSLNDKVHVCLIGKEQTSTNNRTDKEQLSLTDEEQFSFTDKKETSLTDKERSPLTDKERSSKSTCLGEKAFKEVK